MGIFSKPRRVAPALEDPVFGRIVFDRGIWSYVPSTIAEVMIAIDAPESGPTATQRECFRDVRANLPALTEQAICFISNEDKSVDSSLLKVYSIEIGTDAQCLRQSFVIELSDDSADLIYRVSFELNIPVAFQCEDC